MAPPGARDGALSHSLLPTFLRYSPSSRVEYSHPIERSRKPDVAGRCSGTSQHKHNSNSGRFLFSSLGAMLALTSRVDPVPVTAAFPSVNVESLPPVTRPC